MAASTSTRRANTMTINVTAVNDAPAGTDNTVTHARGHGVHLRRGRLRLQRSQRQPGQCAAGGEDHHAAGARARLTLTTAWRSLPASSSRAADITAGKLVFTPAANANGAGYASFTFQVQDDGGTANGGVDLDPSANTHDHRRHRGQRCAGGHRQHGHHAGGHGLHLRRGRLRLQRSERQPGQCAAGGQDHHAAGGGHAHRQRRRGHGRASSSPSPTSLPASWCSRRRPTPTAPATPASPSRCRTTAAPPTAASISTSRANTMTINVTVGQRCAGGHRQHGHHAGGHGVHLHRGRLRLQRSERQPGQYAAGGQDHHAAGAPAR